MGDPRILGREGDPKAILCICCLQKEQPVHSHQPLGKRGPEMKCNNNNKKE